MSDSRATGQFQCEYCGASLRIDETDSQVTVHLADLAEAVTTAADRTQSVLQRETQATRASLQENQARHEIALLQARLQAVGAEIRAVKRTPKADFRQRQLAQLWRLADSLELEIYELQVRYYPTQAMFLSPPPYVNRGYGGLEWVFLSLRGRLGRLAYWPAIPIGLLGVVLFAASAPPFADAWLHGDFEPFLLLWTLLALTLLWAYPAVTVKRYHDRNKSGWWVLLLLLPIVGWLWQFIECGFMPGTDGPNDHE